MSIKTRLGAAVCAAAVVTLTPCAARAGVILPQSASQTATLPVTTTNFNTDQSALSPLVFQQFDNKGGTLQLDEVDLALHAKITSTFGITFVTPSTVTATVGTNDPSRPGPAVTLLEPDGKTPLVTAAPSTPGGLVKSVTWDGTGGKTFGADQTGKYFLAPAVTEASNSLRLTSPADLALFTGLGKVKLPVAGQAKATFHSTSGNFNGQVSTVGTADATVVYKYHEKTPAPEVVPEPSALILWGIGGVSLLAGLRRRRRA